MTMFVYICKITYVCAMFLDVGLFFFPEIFIILRVNIVLHKDEHS